MKVIETKVYTYEELNEKAKEKAREWYASVSDYPWGDEAIDTIKSFVKAFGGKLKNWSLDWSGGSYSSVDFQLDKNVENLFGVRALKWILNNGIDVSGNYPFTGMCFDENALDSVRAFLKNPTGKTIREIVEEGIQNVIKCAQEDYEYQTYGEGAIETIIANEYTFTENGKRFN